MGTRVADYFVISGLDVTSGLEPDQLSGDNLHCHPLERPFKSKVLAFYPENTPGNPFDRNAVGMLCHPKGLRFQIQKDKCDTKFHSFLITREDGSRVSGACLTFYEQVDDRQICSAMDTLQAMHMAELSNAQSRTLYSHLGHVHTRSPKRQIDPQLSGKLYDLRRDTLYSTKCIALISQLPLIATLEQLLRDLLEVALNTSKEPDLPLESYVYNILYEIPMPPPGRSMKLQTAMRSMVCQRPGLNELPLFDYPLREMFHLLGVDNVIDLFSNVLLETQILLYSKDYQRLMVVAEGITSLLFPFSWQHVYVPILPASLQHFLDAPVPFIMGLHHNTADGQGPMKNCSKANMCCVDIDQGTMEMPEDLPTFPYKQDLKEELLLHLNFQFDHLDGSMRDSGFRDSYPPCDSGLSSESGSAASSTWSLASRLELLQHSEALAKITALAKKTGVISSLEDINESWRLETDNQKSRPMDKHMQEMVCNNYIREIFLHYFLQIFSSYESFVILPGGDMESWITNRESMQTYDKAAYLSDQPLSHLPFLSAFIETQMFTTFIDNKILAQWEDEDPQLRVFEARLRNFKEKTGDQREPQHHRHSMCRDSENLLEKRANLIDIVSPSPKIIEVPQKSGAVLTKPGHFPLLNFSVLHKETQIARTKREGVRWRKRDRLHHHSEHLRLSLDSREKHKSLHQPKLADLNPAHVTQTNWKFVETLLKEVKAKTKRMLVAKMGQEAVELGHGEMTVTGVEENTLIASLCDLLERIWSHGLQKNKGGKSALWNHLLSYQEVEEAALVDAVGTDPNLLSPDLSNSGSESEPVMSGTQTWPVRRHKRKPSRGPELPVLNALPVDVLFDMRNVQQMSDIKTEVGYARAWVRLSLEKKLLSRHLKQLLSNTQLLRNLYKRYAFLRCEDEREQFLYHLLSLNAVDYHCFTNTFPNTLIPYRVLIFTRQNSGKIGGSSTTANGWFTLAGQLGETSQVPIPKHTLDIGFQHKNLGVLTTLRIGHDNAGMSPRWLVEHVVVRNEVTSHTYRFPCGRWLGKGVDDGSTERLLVAEAVSSTCDHSELMEKCRTPPRCRSPSMPRRSNEPRMSVSVIQEQLGDAVNNLVKHFFKPEKERGSVTGLLCGEYGLVYCMEHVFQCGFKSARFLRNRFFIWDFLEKVATYFEGALRGEEPVGMTEEAREVITRYCLVVSTINAQASQTVGKDGRFQLFICIGVRNKVLHRWVKMISKTPVTASMYEERSFLRDPNLLTFLIQILESLKDFNIVLEASLIKGIDL